jgi:hypothetical protein
MFMRIVEMGILHQLPILPSRAGYDSYGGQAARRAC